MYVKKRAPVRYRAPARKRGLMSLLGLGGASDCGANQQFYPNLTFNGITGQCSTPSEATAALASGAATGDLTQSSAGTYTPGSSSSSGSSFTDIMGKLLGGFASGATQPPAAPGVVAQRGMSTTTKVAIAGGAVVLLALIARR